MSDQLDFSGFDGAGMGPVEWAHKYAGSNFNVFFALAPEPAMAMEVAAYAAQWDRQHCIGGKLRLAKHLHVSLRPLGAFSTVPTEALDFAQRVGDAVSASAFELVFDRALSFRTKEPTYVLLPGEGAEQTRSLWQALGIAIANADGSSKKTPFTPHMTLSYGGKPVAEHLVEPIRWQVRDFVLINSHQGKSFYETLGRWPLDNCG